MGKQHCSYEYRHALVRLKQAKLRMEQARLEQCRSEVRQAWHPLQEKALEAKCALTALELERDLIVLGRERIECLPAS